MSDGRPSDRDRGTSVSVFVDAEVRLVSKIVKRDDYAVDTERRLGARFRADK